LEKTGRKTHEAYLAQDSALAARLVERVGVCGDYFATLDRTRTRSNADESARRCVTTRHVNAPPLPVAPVTSTVADGTALSSHIERMEDDMQGASEVTGRRVRLWVAYERGHVTGGLFTGTVISTDETDGIRIKLDRGGTIGIQSEDGEPPVEWAAKLLDGIDRVAVAA
jgi:hypothetical protein